ncbi:hypothetical protein EPN90_02890 [Patescibacteria group bacterium]|nr:MAG: hypothetical protein EPN90_02890 [Patescibacteria group bacterium]
MTTKCVFFVVFCVLTAVFGCGGADDITVNPVDPSGPPANQLIPTASSTPTSPPTARPAPLEPGVKEGPKPPTVSVPADKAEPKGCTAKVNGASVGGRRTLAASPDGFLTLEYENSTPRVRWWDRNGKPNPSAYLLPNSMGEDEILSGSPHGFLVHSRISNGSAANLYRFDGKGAFVHGEKSPVNWAGYLSVLVNGGTEVLWNTERKFESEKTGGKTFFTIAPVSPAGQAGALKPVLTIADALYQYGVGASALNGDRIAFEMGKSAWVVPLTEQGEKTEPFSTDLTILDTGTGGTTTSTLDSGIKTVKDGVPNLNSFVINTVATKSGFLVLWARIKNPIKNPGNPGFESYRFITEVNITGKVGPTYEVANWTMSMIPIGPDRIATLVVNQGFTSLTLVILDQKFQPVQKVLLTELTAGQNSIYPLPGFGFAASGEDHIAVSWVQHGKNATAFGPRLAFVACE